MDFVKSKLADAFSDMSPIVVAQSIAKLLLVVYIGVFSQNMPRVMLELMNNVFFKSLMLFGYSVLVLSLNFSTAILVTVAVMVTFVVLGQYDQIEKFSVYSKTWTKADPTQKYIEPTSDLFSGCLHVTKNDLLKIFMETAKNGQDSLKYTTRELYKNADLSNPEKSLMRFARNAGVPYNIQLNDETAPYIATFLINKGFIISGTCALKAGNSPLLYKHQK